MADPAPPSEDLPSNDEQGAKPATHVSPHPTAPESISSNAVYESQLIRESTNANGDAHPKLEVSRARSPSLAATAPSNATQNATNGLVEAQSSPQPNGEPASPGRLQKTASEDSEAETEILTPRKPRNRRLSESSDDGHPVEPYSARKRRASGQPKMEHTEEADGPYAFQSRKRARLQVHVDDQAWEEDTRSNEPEERERKPRLTRKAESESRVHSAKDDNMHMALDISRATTVPPKAFPNPALPKPVSHSPTHRRDSSVHSSAMIPRPKDVDRNGRTPLARACHDGDVERVSTFIATSKDMLNRPDYAGNTPLPLAVAKGHTEVVNILIEAGANVNNINHQGETPLKDAIDRGDVDVIGLLRRAGAVLNPPKPCKDSEPLGLPAHRHHYRNPTSAAALLDYINTGDDEGINTCLGAETTPNNDCVIASICSDKPQYLEMMLGFGGNCDPDPERFDNKTPMVVAIESGNIDAVKLLLQNGADPRRLILDDLDYKTLINNIGGQNSEEMWSLLDEAVKNAPPRKEQETEQSSEDQHKVPEVDEELIRQEYLESLPRALSRALDGGDMPLRPMKGRDHPNRKTLLDWQPIYRTRLKDIEPECDPESAEEPWFLNIFASVFLKHKWLDDIKKMVSATLEVTDDHRKDLWERAGLFDRLVLTERHDRVANLEEHEELLKDQQIPYSVIGKQLKMISIDWQGIWAEQREKWMQLPKECLFWVKVEDFLELAMSDDYLHLKDYPVLFEPPIPSMTRPHLYS